MPAHDTNFTDVDSFELEPPLVLNGATRACIVETKAAQLRRLNDSETEFSPSGLYRESWIAFPNWRAAGIQGLYGFRSDKVLSGKNRSNIYGGSIGYQLSNNNGSTWLYYDGSGWSVAGASNWNSEEVVDEYISSFPIDSSKQLQVRVKLVPGSGGTSTPLIKNVTVYADLDFDFQDDMLRSMKRWLEQHVWVRTQYFDQIPQPLSGTTGCSFTAPSGASDVLYMQDKKWEEFSEPASVYNLTVDPNRTTNLFSGFVDGGIQMISAQQGVIEANFMARPPVYIAAEEFMQLSSIPSIVLQMTNVKERRDMRWGNDEIDWALAKKRAKRNVHRVWFDTEFRISCQSDLRAEALRMSDAVNRALTQYQYVTSLAHGDEMAVPYATPLSGSDRVAQGLYVRDYVCTVYGKAWLRPELTVERYLSENIRFHMYPSEFSTPGDTYSELVEVLP